MSDYVGDELIAEIFERLPIKSLLRCRSLSKSWYYRIGSPHFIRNHTLRSAKNPQKVLIRHQAIFVGGLKDFCTLHPEDQLPLSRKDGYIGITPVEFPVSHNFNIVGSCNGILCLFDPQRGGITLWNPSIRCKLELPHHPSLTNSSKNDPRGVAIGFGFDPITDEYKVVKISFSPIGGAAPESLIYTINTGTWRAISSSPTTFSYVTLIDKSFVCACFVNGALHWVVEDSNNIGRRYIMSFDVSTEVFGRIELAEPELDWLSRQLMIMEGSLAVVSSDSVDSWIWVMKEYKNVASWSIVFKLEALLCDGVVDTVYFRTTNGDLVFNAYFQGFKVYNPATMVSLKLVEFKAGFDIVDMEICTENLVLLNRGTPCIGNAD